MAISLTPRVEREIGFLCAGVYYFDLGNEQTLVVYDTEGSTVYDYPISHFRYVYGREGFIQTIYTKE